MQTVVIYENYKMVCDKYINVSTYFLTIMTHQINQCEQNK